MFMTASFTTGSKTSRGHWLVPLAAIVAGITSAGSAGAQGCLSGTLGDEWMAERVGLVREWIIQVPFDSAGYRLEHVVVADGLVVAQSGDGGVHVIQAAHADATGAATARGEKGQDGKEPDKKDRDGKAPDASSGGTKAADKAGDATVAIDHPFTVGKPQPGTLLWSTRIGTRGGPVEPAGVGASLVTVARDIDLFALDRQTGHTRWHDRLGRLPATAATPIGDWVYAPLHSDGVLRLPADPHRGTAAGPAAKATAKKPVKKKGRKAPQEKKPIESLEPLAIDAGGRLEQPVIPFPDGPMKGSLLWCTTDGTLVILEPTEADWQRHEFFLESAPVGRPVIRDTAIFVATANRDLARIEMRKPDNAMRTKWHVILYERPDAAPILAGKAVVVSQGEAGISAYSAEDGSVLWHSHFPGRILAASTGRIWVLDRTGRLSSLDATDGTLRERVCLGGFSFPVLNTSTDRLVLATPGGLIVSLAPRQD
jgi:outer membrane protein assembly factor BamB